MTYEGELTPEMLIQGISDLTDWDLTLAEEVTRDKDGMGVCLSWPIDQPYQWTGAQSE